MWRDREGVRYVVRLGEVIGDGRGCAIHGARGCIVRCKHQVGHAQNVWELCCVECYQGLLSETRRKESSEEKRRSNAASRVKHRLELLQHTKRVKSGGIAITTRQVHISAGAMHDVGFKHGIGPLT